MKKCVQRKISQSMSQKYVTKICHIFAWMGVKQRKKCHEKMCATKNVTKYVTKICYIFDSMSVEQRENIIK